MAEPPTDPSTTLSTKLGGEYIEDRIHDIIKWEYTPATHLGDDIYQITATSSITPTLPTVPSTVQAQLPWDLTIDHPRQTVTANPDWPSATLSLPKLPDLPDASDAVDKATQAVDETAPKVKEAINNTIPELGDQTESIIDKFK